MCKVKKKTKRPSPKIKLKRTKPSNWSKNKDHGPQLCPQLALNEEKKQKKKNKREKKRPTERRKKLSEREKKAENHRRQP